MWGRRGEDGQIRARIIVVTKGSQTQWTNNTLCSSPVLDNNYTEKMDTIKIQLLTILCNAANRSMHYRGALALIPYIDCSCQNYGFIHSILHVHIHNNFRKANCHDSSISSYLPNFSCVKEVSLAVSIFKALSTKICTWGTT